MNGSGSDGGKREAACGNESRASQNGRREACSESIECESSEPESRARLSRRRSREFISRFASWGDDQNLGVSGIRVQPLGCGVQTSSRVAGYDYLNFVAFGHSAKTFSIGNSFARPARIVCGNK
jgi:hypothetical protein